jgi:hypothetical protein
LPPPARTAVNFFSSHELAARKLVESQPAPTATGRDTRIMVVGASRFGMALTVELARQRRLAGARSEHFLDIVIVDDRAHAATDRFRRRYTRQEAVEAVRATGARVHQHYGTGRWLPHCSLAPRARLERLPVVAAAVYDVLPLPARVVRAALIDSTSGKDVAAAEPALTSRLGERQTHHLRRRQLITIPPGWPTEPDASSCIDPATGPGSSTGRHCSPRFTRHPA